MLAGDHPSADFAISEQARFRRFVHLPMGMEIVTIRLPPEVQKALPGLFGPDDACFLCDEPVGEGRVFSLWLDPQNSAMFNAAPVCAACNRLPPAVKRAKELAMLRAIWPRGRWRVQKGADPAYLRGRR